MNYLDIGYGNLVNMGRIISILNTNSAPIKRMIAKARESDQLFDTTGRRPSQAAVVTDNGYIYLSYLKPKSLVAKVTRNEQIENN